MGPWGGLKSVDVERKPRFDNSSLALTRPTWQEPDLWKGRLGITMSDLRVGGSTGATRVWEELEALPLPTHSPSRTFSSLWPTYMLMSSGPFTLRERM